MFTFIRSVKHNANALNPEDDEAKPLPVGNEFVDSTIIPYFSILGRTSPNSLSLGEFLYALDETLHLI